MRRVIVLSCLVLCLMTSTSVVGQVEKGKKIVAMLIPNPRAPITAENNDSPATEAAYNTITSYLIDHDISVIDKNYVDQALEELKNQKDLDIDAASIKYGKKNTADRAILFYVTDKSGSTVVKHFECTLRAINVQTGEVLAVETGAGEHREDKEKAATSAAKAAIEVALPKIIGGIFTVTFIGNVNLKVQEKLDNVFAEIAGIKSFDGYLVAENKYEYRVSYLYDVQPLRNKINQASRKTGYKLELDQQTISSLSFYLLPDRGPWRTVAAIAMLGSAAAAGTSYYLANDNFEKYKSARTYSEVIKYKQNTQDWDKYTMVAAGGTAVFGIWYFLETKSSGPAPKRRGAKLEWYSPKTNTYGLSLQVNF